MKAIHATDAGRHIALSGLLPETANDLLSYVARRGGDLVTLLPADTDANDQRYNQFDFCMLYACLTSSEFTGLTRTRFIPFGFRSATPNPHAEALVTFLTEPRWLAYRDAANGALLLLEWTNGTPVADLEGRFEAVKAGGIQGLAREVSWCLSGFTNILASATRLELSEGERPQTLRGQTQEALSNLRRFLPALRRLIWRINVGLPPSVLWMSELMDAVGRRAVTRPEALALHTAGLTSYTNLRQRNNWADLIDALRKAGIKHAQDRAKEIQAYAHDWHLTLRERTRARLKAALGASDSSWVDSLIDSREKAFESALETALTNAQIKFTLFDDGSGAGRFDYLIHIPDRPDFVLECKTCQGNALLDLNSARVVLASAVQWGHADKFCVTLCNPGINPDVLPDFGSCAQLAIVEAHDMAEALTRLVLGKLTAQAFCDWITQPGLAKVENIISTSSSNAGT